MKSKFLFIALLFFSSRSYSQWEKIAQSADSTPIYINPIYVTEVKDYKGNSYKKGWVKANLNNVAGNDGKIYDNVESKTLHYVNCSNLREKILSIQFYKSTGEILLSKDFPLDETNPWINIIPESVGEIIFQKICSVKK